MRRARVDEVVVVAWSTLLAALVLGPALAPGYVLSYDMVWVPDLALRPDFLGLASGLPRAVPSDAVVSVLDEAVPAALLQKLVLLVPLAAGGWGTSRLVAGPVAVRLVTASAYVWNAFVAERLLIGHWPVLVAYGTAPWVVLAARAWRDTGRTPSRLWWLLPVGSLSAGAGVASAVLLVAFGGGRGRTGRLVALVLVSNAPWVVAGLLHAGTARSDAAGAEVFALHGEGSVPGPLAALTLGGVWNAEVVPSSREGLLGWASLLVLAVLAAAGWRSWTSRTSARDRIGFVACWVVGAGVAVLTWAAPRAVGWSSAHVPGGGVLRDGARLLLLCAPLYAVLLAEGVRAVWARVPVVPAARVGAGVGLVLLPVALLPGAAWGLAGQLRAVTFPAAYAEARDVVADRGRGDVLVLPATSYRQPRWNGDRKVLDPVGRYLTPDYVASDELVVSGRTLEGEDPRFVEAMAALGRDTPEQRSEALGRIGIGVVVTDRSAPGSAPVVAGTALLDAGDLRVVALPAVQERRTPVGWLVAVVAAWVAYAGSVLGGAIAGAAGLRARRRRASGAGDWRLSRRVG